MKQKKILISLLLVVLCLPVCLGVASRPQISTGDSLSSSSLGLSNLLRNLFTTKLQQFGQVGYFPQQYEPSIQATYYAIETLAALELLDTINVSEIIAFIMSFYDPNGSLFIDRYAQRWLNIDPMAGVYPLSSLLQVNCYAVLTLQRLGSLDIIDLSAMRSFIWSCYNPIIHGFIGGPYDIELPDILATPTMDNTFFAIQVLDIIDNWVNHFQVRENLIQLITSLQCIEGPIQYFGGFFNDPSPIYSYLGIPEPNLLSSYYNIKSLEFFNALDEMDVPKFQSYLANLYYPTEFFFHFFYGFQERRQLNIIGTALALELADLVGFTAYNRTNTLQFVVDNRNNLGTWDQSTNIQYHELIDTYQVIRSLQSMNRLTLLTTPEKEAIGEALKLYLYKTGYSLLSQDFTSLELIYSLTGAFDLLDKTHELPVSELYNLIAGCCSYDPDGEEDLVYGSTNLNFYFPFYRSVPIEYYCVTTDLNTYEMMFARKNTFYLLDLFTRMNRLSWFAGTHNLEQMMDTIIDTQFLNTSYRNHGGFLPSKSYKHTRLETQNHSVVFDNSYYALRSLELLSTYLCPEIKFTTIGLNISAFQNYIMSFVVESTPELYFNPNDSENVENLLEATYFALYMLSTIEYTSLDITKVEEFVTNHINYTNLKNVYYCYKIANLLDLNVYFYTEDITALILNLYDAELHEFYLSTQKESISHEAIYWVSELESNLVNPSYKDTNILKDFFPEFTHIIILSGILITAPVSVLFISSKKLGIMQSKHKTKSKKLLI